MLVITYYIIDGVVLHCKYIFLINRFIFNCLFKEYDIDNKIINFSLRLRLYQLEKLKTLPP